ncbi:MAG: hypothetical protein K1X89_11375 [Myxococcaceae bacterium]|nr:hypothetical protein [Myxococcaceae bacterium]
MSDPSRTVERLEAELNELRERLSSLETARSARPPRRRALLGVLAAVALLGSAVAYGQATCSQTLASLGMVTFCANNPAVAADVNTNFTALVNLVQAKVGTLSAGATSTQTITAARMNIGGPVSSASHITGGNSSGNIHIDGTANGNVYLGWYSGKGTVFGSGSQSEVARIDPSGNLTLSGTINSHRPIQVASNSCTGTNSSCTATCAAGVIKTAWGFHGGNGANTDFGFAQNTCGSFVQWKGSCIGQSSCTVSTGCNASSIILECW